MVGGFRESPRVTCLAGRMQSTSSCWHCYSSQGNSMSKGASLEDNERPVERGSVREDLSKERQLEPDGKKSALAWLLSREVEGGKGPSISYPLSPPSALILLTSLQVSWASDRILYTSVTRQPRFHPRAQLAQCRWALLLRTCPPYCQEGSFHLAGKALYLFENYYLNE